MARLFEFSDWFFYCPFRDDLIFALSSDWSVKVLEEVDFCSLEENFGLLIRTNLLVFTLACLE